MTSRVLPFDEWHRLPESLDPILMELSPVKSRICVVEDKGEIVAHWLLFPVIHAECVWIAPKKRKTGRTAKKLIDLMRETARELGVDRVVGSSDSEPVTRLLAKPMMGGIPIPALMVTLPVGER
jgi:hypothetical protein